MMSTHARCVKNNQRRAIPTWVSRILQCGPSLVITHKSPTPPRRAGKCISQILWWDPGISLCLSVCQSSLHQNLIKLMDNLTPTSEYFKERSYIFVYKCATHQASAASCTAKLRKHILSNRLHRHIPR